MSLQLDDEHKSHLTQLAEFDAAVVAELCRIAVEFLQNGVNSKLYSGAGQKLRVDAEIVQSMVEGVMQLFTEASKQNLTEEQMLQSLQSVDISELHRAQLSAAHQAAATRLRHVLGLLAPRPPQYKGLEWRFDVQVASRMLRHQVTPQMLLKLHLSDGGGGAAGAGEQRLLLQADPVQLAHLTHALETALDQMRSNHARRVARSIK